MIGLIAVMAGVPLFLFLVPSLLDLNRYKPEFSAWLQANTGSTVKFGGDLGWSVLPAPSILVTDITVANPPGFGNQPLLSVIRGELQIEWLTLLQHKFSLKRFVIDGFTLNLSRDKHGRGNWQWLTGARQPSNSQAGMTDNNLSDKAAALMALVPESLELSNGQVNWDDQQTGVQLAFNNVKVSIESRLVRSGVKVELESEILSPLSLPKSGPALVKLTSGLHFDNAAEKMIVDEGRMQVLGMDALMPYQFPVVTITTDAAAIDGLRQTLSLPNLQLEAGQLTLALHDISVANLQTRPELMASVEISRFIPRILLNQLGFKIDGIPAKDALATATATFDLQATSENVVMKNVSLTVDDSHLIGFVNIDDFARPLVGFNLRADRLDLGRYLPPSESSGQYGRGIAWISAQLDTLKGLPAQGELNVDELTVNGVMMKGVQFQVGTNTGQPKPMRSMKFGR